MRSLVKVVLHLLIAFPPLGRLSLALAVDCDSADVVLGAGESRVISITHTAGNTGSISLFVKPESDFEGVELIVYRSDGSENGEWFPAEPECFVQDNTWYQLSTALQMYIDDQTVDLVLMTGACWKGCAVNITSPSFQSLRVVGHGPSKWIRQVPDMDCDITYPSRILQPDTLPTCKDAPPYKTSQHTPFPLWLILLLSTVCIIFLILGGVLFFRFYVRRYVIIVQVIAYTEGYTVQR